jgi:hypothetical protein
VNRKPLACRRVVGANDDAVGFKDEVVIEGDTAAERGQTAVECPRHPQQSPRSARILSDACSPATIIPYWGLTVNIVGMMPPSTM